MSGDTATVVPVHESRCYRGCCASSTVRLDVKPNDVQWGDAISGDPSAPSAVYRCTYTPSADGGLGATGIRDWAVKVPKVRTGEDLDRFHAELGVMSKLNGHTHVAELAAGLAYPPRYALAMPFYAGGSLGALIHARGVVLTFGDAVRCLVGLVRGLKALHDLGHIHRDVKPDNALLDVGRTAVGAGPHVRLADLGLAVPWVDTKDEDDAGQRLDADYKRRNGAPSGGFHKKHLVGTLRYLAPEVLSKVSRHTPASDIYALAVTACELVCGVVPYSDCTKDPELHTVIEMGYGEQALQAAVCADGLRPNLPSANSGVPRAFVELVERMWHADPESRPGIADVLEALEHMAEPFCTVPPHPSIAVGGAYGFETPLSDVSSAAELHAGVPSRFSDAVDATLLPAWASPSLQGTEDPSAAGCTKVWSGLFSSQGPRDTQEDRHVVCENIGGVVGLHLLAVFDGHRGSECAVNAANELPLAIIEALASGACLTPEECLERVFAALERNFAQAARTTLAAGASARHPCVAGATAVVALVLPSGGAAPGYGTLVVAHAGDSALILFGGDGASAENLTPPHTASDPAERASVLARGGTVVDGAGGPRVDGRIQVTRGLGDIDLKPSLSAVPSTRRVPLGPEHSFLVLCSDGVTDVLKPAEIAALAAATVPQPSMLARRLVDEAVNSRNSQDNATAIVAFLQPILSHKRVR